MQNESAAQRFNRIQQTVQEAVLRDYPNPERQGCPGNEVLKRLAFPDVPQTEDPAWYHVTHCSPCYSEFLAFRDDRKKQKRRMRYQRRAVLAAAALVLLGVWVVFRWTRVERPQQKARSEVTQVAKLTPLAVYLDAETIETRRARASTEDQTHYRLPLGDLDLKIHLPAWVSPGPYQIQLQGEPGKSPLASSEGIASSEDNAVFLRTRINLTGLKKGSYYLAFRTAGSEWTILPVELT